MSTVVMHEECKLCHADIEITFKDPSENEWRGIQSNVGKEFICESCQKAQWDDMGCYFIEDFGRASAQRSEKLADGEGAPEASGTVLLGVGPGYIVRRRF